MYQNDHINYNRNIHIIKPLQLLELLIIYFGTCVKINNFVESRDFPEQIIVARCKIENQNRSRWEKESCTFWYTKLFFTTLVSK